MKADVQYFYVILFIRLYKVTVTFKSVDQTLVCNYWLVRGIVYFSVQAGQL